MTGRRQRALWSAAAALLLAACAPRAAEPAPPAASPAPQAVLRADGSAAVRLSILLWNVEGLPFPARRDRAPQLAAIGAVLRQWQADGRAPDIVLLQEVFSDAAQAAAQGAGYRHRVWGPGGSAQRRLPAAPLPLALERSSSLLKGEGVGKLLPSGLALLTNLPVIAARAEPFSPQACAGYDCLANKGGLAAHVAIPGVPEPLTIFLTHRNALAASGVAPARAEAAHAVQTRENDMLLSTGWRGAGPLLAAGDFNRQRAGDRAGHFADLPGFRLVGQQPGSFAATAFRFADPAPWQRHDDLIGFHAGSAVRLVPLAMTPLFDGRNGPALSDHGALLVIAELRWDSAARRQRLRSDP